MIFLIPLFNGQFKSIKEEIFTLKTQYKNYYIVIFPFVDLLINVFSLL